MKPRDIIRSMANSLPPLPNGQHPKLVLASLEKRLALPKLSSLFKFKPSGRLWR